MNQHKFIAVLVGALLGASSLSALPVVVDAEASVPGANSSLSQASNIGLWGDDNKQLSSASRESSSVSPTYAANLSVNERLLVVQKSLANLVQMDFPAQLNQLQQTIAQLRGQIEVLQHQLQQQAKQSQQQYADLDQRLSKSVASTAVTTSLSPKTSRPVTPKAAESVTKAATPALQEKRTYEAAYGLIQMKAYQQALDAFNAYLSIYPAGQYAGNAYYWLGELYAMQGDQAKALSSLKRVAQDFKQSPKVADAMLRLGMMYQKQGDKQQALMWFKRVVQSHKGSTSAHLAKQQIEQLDT
jgi:tol-pal system protein YbgF